MIRPTLRLAAPKLVAIGVLVLLAPDADQAQSLQQIRFRATVLGSLDGDDTSAAGMNDAGQITGWSGQFAGAAIYQAFRCGGSAGIEDLNTMGFTRSRGLMIAANGAVAGIGSLWTGAAWADFPFRYDDVFGMQLITCINGPGTSISGINDAGQVAMTLPMGAGVQQAFLGLAEGGMLGLWFSGASSTYASAINSAGQVVGYSAGDYYRAIRWNPDGTATDLGSLGGTFSVALGINDDGHVVGDSTLPSGWQRAFLWSPGTGMQDLQTIPGALMSSAQRINDSGMVVGTLLTESCSQSAFYYTPAEGMVDIGVLGEFGFLQPNALNDAGQFVGNGYRGDTNQNYAFYFSRATGHLDLNEHLTAPLGFAITSAVDINNRGQIIAIGYQNGKTRSVLLTPTGRVHPASVRSVATPPASEDR